MLALGSVHAAFAKLTFMKLLLGDVRIFLLQVFSNIVFLMSALCHDFCRPI